MAEDFQIKITTTGDPKGAEQVAAALKGVTKATEENAKSSRTLTDDLVSLGSRQNATKDVVEGLDAALKGNANSMFGVAKAATNLWEIFTVSTPAGRALQLALIGVNVALQVFQSRAAATNDTAKDTAGNLDAMREAAETFNKVRFDTINAQFDAVKAKADSAATFFQRVADLSKQLDDASMSLEIARLNADGSLSPEERTAREQQIRDRYGRRALERDEGLRGEQIGNLRTLAGAAGTKAEQAEAQRAMDAFLVSGLAGQRAGASDRLRAAEEAMQRGSSGDAEQDLLDRAIARGALARAQSDPALGSGFDAQLQALETRLKASEAAAAAAKKEAEAAQRKLADAERLAPLEQRTGRELAALRASERYTAAGLAEPSVRRAPDSDVRRPPPIIDAFSLQALGREQGKSAAQILREYQAAWEQGLRDEMRQRETRIESAR